MRSRSIRTLADAHYNLGCLLSGQARTDEALACHQAAIAADPNFGAAKLAACMAQLPILYRSMDEVTERRAHYAAALEDLTAQAAAPLADAIGKYQPFFLPYQGEDDRVLQSLYGQFACRALAETNAPLPLATFPAHKERIRVGIVSGFFCDHTLFKLFLEGWLSQLDRSRFEVIGFHTGSVMDGQTARCADWCDRFVHGLPSAAAWREAIAATKPHVLLYPEVGMDPVAGRLAAMRLAPVQCVAWGQPETTGMPTIDYFLSSALMEPPEGDGFYTESLVRLPDLGAWYKPDVLLPDVDCVRPGLTRVGLGLDREAPVFWSGQALYKYLPVYDCDFPADCGGTGAVPVRLHRLRQEPGGDRRFPRPPVWCVRDGGSRCGPACRHPAAHVAAGLRGCSRAGGCGFGYAGMVGWKVDAGLPFAGSGDRDDAGAVHARATHGRDPATDRL